MEKKVSIAIIGSRGIPNKYGGFEKLAEILSVGLKERGFDVYVYNSHDHTNQTKKWFGVNIIHKYNPEIVLPGIGVFIYDLNCIIDCRKRKFDIVLQLGYATSSLWTCLIPKRSRVITNMDGLEWKRAKYGFFTKRYIRLAEILAAKWSDELIADSPVIEKYLSKFKTRVNFISYGADIFNSPDPSHVSKFDVELYSYNILIARMVPENNIEMILEGFLLSNSQIPFLVIGNLENRYGRYIAKKFDHPNVRFLGPIFDKEILNNLRYYSNLYFHGHMAGGTNPSLLEAMASEGLICAHGNVFNKTVLGEDALYFRKPLEVAEILNTQLKNPDSIFIKSNLVKIEQHYSWESIIDGYDQVFKRVNEGSGEARSL